MSGMIIWMEMSSLLLGRVLIVVVEEDKGRRRGIRIIMLYKDQQ